MNNKEFKDLIMQMNAFRRMDEQEKKRFINFPICHFGNLIYERNEEY